MHAYARTLPLIALLAAAALPAPAAAAYMTVALR